MKISLLFTIALLAPGCSVAPPPKENCTTVVAVKSNPELCVGRSIQIRAYLISTQHGEYLVDAPNGTNVLSAEISESKLHTKATSELLEKLGRANKGKPFATVYGTFEGRLVTNQRGEAEKLEIYSEVINPR